MKGARYSLRRVRRIADDAPEIVLRPESAVRPGQVVAFSVSLVAAGVLLARGFIGLIPGRPTFVVLGLIVAANAVLGLTIDHVQVRSSRQRPDHALLDELNRSRRYGHSLTLVRFTCSEEQAERIIRRLRGTDRAWRQRRTTIAMLSETDLAGALEFLDRLGNLAPHRAVEVASFPEDAVTVDGLYAALRERPVGIVGLVETESVEPSDLSIVADYGIQVDDDLTFDLTADGADS